MTPIVTDTTLPATTAPGAPAAVGEGAVFAALMAGQVANDSGTETGATPGNALPTARQQFAGVDTPPIIITPPDANPDPEQVLQGVIPGLKPQAGPKPLPIILTPPMPPVETGDGAIQAPIPQASPKDGGQMPPIPVPPLRTNADATIQTGQAAPDEVEVQAPVPGSAPKSQPPIPTVLPTQTDVVQVQLPVPAKPKSAKPVAVPAAILLAQFSQPTTGSVPAVKGKKEEEKAGKDDTPDAKPAMPDAAALPIVIVPPPARPEPQRIILTTGTQHTPLPLPASAADARPAPAPLPGGDMTPKDVQPTPAPAKDAQPNAFSDLLTARASAPAEPKIVYPLRAPAPDNQAPAKLTIADLARSSASDAMARAQTVQPEQAPLSALPAAGKAEAPLPDFGAPVAAAAPLPQVAPVMQVVQPRAPVAIAAPVPMPVNTARADWIAKIVDRIDEMKIQGGRAAEIRLLPDALGTVDVRIEHRGDQLNVSFTADNPHARALLTEAAPKLAEMAEARGLRLGQTGVDQGQNNDRRPAQTMPDAPLAPRSAFADSDSETDTGRADAGRIA